MYQMQINIKKRRVPGRLRDYMRIPNFLEQCALDRHDFLFVGGGTSARALAWLGTNTLTRGQGNSLSTMEHPDPCMKAGNYREQFLRVLSSRTRMISRVEGPCHYSFP